MALKCHFCSCETASHRPDLPDVAIGDEVVLWGEDLPANELAAHAETIGYEIMTRMMSRVPRKYLG